MSQAGQESGPRAPCPDPVLPRGTTQRWAIQPSQTRTESEQANGGLLPTQTALLCPPPPPPGTSQHIGPSCPCVWMQLRKMSSHKWKILGNSGRAEHETGPPIFPFLAFCLGDAPRGQGRQGVSLSPEGLRMAWCLSVGKSGQGRKLDFLLFALFLEL